MRQIGVVPADYVIRQPPHALCIATRRKILEGSDTNVAGRDAGENSARQRRLPQYALAGHDRGKRARGRNAKPRHRLADNVFAQDRAERGAAVAAAGKRRRAGPLELDVAADAVRVDHLAEQDGAAVAELGNEMAELVPGIGHCNRVRAFGNAFSSENLGSLPAGEPIRIETEMDRERPVQLDQPGRRDGRGHDGRDAAMDWTARILL